MKASGSQFLLFEKVAFYRRLMFWGAVGLWNSRSGSVAKVLAEGDGNESEYD